MSYKKRFTLIEFLLIFIIIFIILVVIACLVAYGEVAGDKKDKVTVKTISQIPAKGAGSSGWDTKATVIQIEDLRNGVVCYGLVPTSEGGRALSAGYPGTSISCIKSK